MKRITAFILAIVMMLTLCACGTTEKWLLTREIWDDYEYTYTYDVKGNVTEILETDFDSCWLRTHMKNKKLDYVESNYNELYASDGCEMMILLEGDYQFTLMIFLDNKYYHKLTHTVNEQGRIIHSDIVEYYNGVERIIDRRYDTNNVLIETTTTLIDYDTDEVLDKYTDKYYCTFDSNGIPADLYYVGDDEYEDESQCQFIWNYTEVKK